VSQEVKLQIATARSVKTEEFGEPEEAELDEEERGE